MIAKDYFYNKCVLYYYIIIMKKIILFILLLLANKLYADDTAAIQAMIDAGNTTLPAHHSYTITRINLSHSLNANGSTFNCLLPGGAAFTMTTPGVKLSNAEIVGQSDITNTGGSWGVEVNGDNDTVTRAYIHKFTAYGILGGDGNTPVITYNKVTDIGYVGVFFVSGKHDIHGGTVAHDTIDRSMLDAQTVTQGALFLRGGKDHFSPGWKVHHNLLIMPFLPKDITSECFELRTASHSVIYDNVCIGGSIGISVVKSDYVITSRNNCTKQKEEGIEYADSNNGMVKDNIIRDQAGLGMLLDGFAPLQCSNDTIMGNKIANCKSHGIQLFKDTHDIVIRDCDITTSTKAVNIQGAYGVKLENCHLHGDGTGHSVGLFFDNSQGKVTMHGGSMDGFGHKFYIYTNKAVTTDDILLDKVKDKNNAAEFDKTLSGGGGAGNNIKINKADHN